MDELKKAAGMHAEKPPPFRREKDEAKQAAALARVAGASWPPFVKGKRRENGPWGERESGGGYIAYNGPKWPNYRETLEYADPITRDRVVARVGFGFAVHVDSPLSDHSASTLP